MLNTEKHHFNSGSCPESETIIQNRNLWSFHGKRISHHALPGQEVNKQQHQQTFYEPLLHYDFLHFIRTEDKRLIFSAGQSLLKCVSMRQESNTSCY